VKQLGQIEAEKRDWEIKPGDIVRLLQPFRPERYGSQEYAFAIVAGVSEITPKEAGSINLVQTLKKQHKSSQDWMR